MAKHYRRIKAVVEVVDEYYEYSGILSTPGSGVEAFLAELLQDAIVSPQQALGALIQGLDLDLRAKRTGKIRQVYKAAESGKVAEAMVWETLAQVVDTAEFAAAVNDGVNPRDYALEIARKNPATLPKGVGKDEAKVIQEAWRAERKKSLGKEA